MQSKHDIEWKREREPLDFSPPSGSIGNNTYAHGPTEHDGSANTNTTFYPDEAAPDTRNWGHMNQIQDGKYEGGDRDKRRRHADQKRDLDIFMEHVQLTEWEKNYAYHLLEELHNYEMEFDDENTQGTFYGSGEALVLAVITYAANKNERMIRQKTTFKSLRDDCNVAREEIKTTRAKIRTIV